LNIHEAFGFEYFRLYREQNEIVSTTRKYFILLLVVSNFIGVELTKFKFNSPVILWL